MPRNSQGLYTLPAGNPVVPNTLIESNWANPTMDDIAAALTGSLPRDGSAPMTGLLTLSADAPTQPRHAISKGYMDQFLAYATGMPIGSVVAFAGASIPAGFFECNGQLVSRTTYSALFAAIGTTYGAGDSSTTFNVPDMRDEFIRGKSDTRPLGNKQAAAFAAHVHAVNDPGHNHTINDPSHAHSASQPAHTHGVNDPGHSHSINVSSTPGSGFAYGTGNLANGTTSTTGANITIQAGGGDAVTVNLNQSGVSNNAAATGVSLGASGGDETRPQNIAQIYIIKAVNDSSGPATLTGITTSDAQMISVDNTNPVAPDLVIHSNVAFGTVKLDASGQIPLNLLPTGSQQLLGYWDASGGQTPSQASPTTNFASGDTYIISVTGLLTVYDPVTLTASPTTVAVGSLLQYIENSLTNPTGWYYVVASTTVVASQVGLTPVGNISATNVQAGFAEVDGDLTTQAAAIAVNTSAIATKVTKTSDTGSALIPAGTDAQRDGSPVFGALRANTDQTIQEWWNGSAWTQLGGMTQAAAEAAFLQVDGGNQMLAPLVFDSNTNAVVRVGATNVAQLPTTCGIPFCKNKLFNGEVTRINQRGFDGNWATKNTWGPGNTIEQQELCYGYDMWARSGLAGYITQVIEAGNFRPSTVHTASCGNGTFSPYQTTSPDSGNWVIAFPEGARNIQVEEGSVATPFELRPVGFELEMCQRYFERCVGGVIGYSLASGSYIGAAVTFRVEKRVSNGIVWFSSMLEAAANINGNPFPETTTELGFNAIAQTSATGLAKFSAKFLASAVI